MSTEEIVANCGPRPGDDPIERLQHVNRVYAGQEGESMAVMATSNIYGHGVTTGLTFGDLAVLEDAIRKDEREKIIETLQRSGHIKS
jgi:hypothetical protein